MESTTAVGVAAVVPAAGSGSRLGPGAPKALRTLAGETMLAVAVRALAATPEVAWIVVVAPQGSLELVRASLEPVVGPTGVGLAVVAGGRDRQESVRAGLAAVPASAEVVLVHDAARPLAPVALIQAVIAGVRAGAAAVVPGLALADTVKQVDAGGRVLATPDRSALRAIQTPQGFRASVLRAAHAQVVPGPAATDDASLVERQGIEVRVVPGSPDAFKITGPLDLVLAEAVLAARRSAGVL